MSFVVWSRCGTPYSGLLVKDTQQQVAASRLTLRAGQRER